MAALPYLYSNADSYYISSFDRSGGNDDGFRGTYSQLYVDDNGEHVIFDEEGPGWCKKAGAWFDINDAESRVLIEEYDKKVGNLPIYDLPENEKARWKEALQPVVDGWVADMEAQGLPGKDMVEDITELLEKYSQ